MIDSVLAWAKATDWVRVVALTGSRVAGTPDAYSDYDIQLYHDGKVPESTDWLTTFGDIWVMIAPGYWRGDLFIPTYLVVYEGGVKVDFSLWPLALLPEVYNAPPGIQILLDKDAHDLTCQPTGGHPAPPTQAAFMHVVTGFWFEAYHVANYLKRGDLWLAKFRDWSTKERLLRMLEWHAETVYGRESYYLGKQMQSWTPPEIWDDLHTVFGHFDAADSWRALLATLDVFRRVAKETAAQLAYPYPDAMDAHIAGYIRALQVT